MWGAIVLLLICLSLIIFIWKKVLDFMPKDSRFPKGKESEIPKELAKLEFSLKRGGYFRKGVDDKGVTIDPESIFAGDKNNPDPKQPSTKRGV